MQIGKKAEPLKSFRFLVEIDGIAIAKASERLIFKIV